MRGSTVNCGCLPVMSCHVLTLWRLAECADRAGQEFGQRLQEVDDPDMARERTLALKATRRLLRVLNNVSRSRAEGDGSRLTGAPSWLTGSEYGKSDNAGSEQVPSLHQPCAASWHASVIIVTAVSWRNCSMSRDYPSRANYIPHTGAPLTPGLCAIQHLSLELRRAPRLVQVRSAGGGQPRRVRLPDIS